MRLYDLVTFKHSLTANLNIAEVIDSINKLCQNLASIKTQAITDQKNTEFVDQLIAHYQTLLDQIKLPLDFKQEKIKEIDSIITNESHKLFANSYEIETRNGGYENVRDHRKITVHQDTEQLIKQRIMLYTNWRYPALEIGCRQGEWTQYMVSADPLYIMAQFPEFLKTTNEVFPSQYQNRLRKYLINTKTHDFGALPQGQMGFIFSWDYFNYISLDTFTQAIKQIQSLLRPGGVFLFSYNDGDTSAGMGMAESMAQTYLPKSLLIPTCQSVGLEIVSEQNVDTNIHWLEVKKPGSLHTVKAHQVLGEIKQREN